MGEVGGPRGAVTAVAGFLRALPQRGRPRAAVPLLVRWYLYRERDGDYSSTVLLQ